MAVKCDARSNHLLYYISRDNNSQLDKLNKLDNIYFSFATYFTPPSISTITNEKFIYFPLEGSNTITYNGETYILKRSDITQSPFTGNVFNMINFTFKCVNNNILYAVPKFIVLRYRLEYRANASMNKFINAILHGGTSSGAISILDLTKESPNHIAYTTCIGIKKDDVCDSFQILVIDGDKPFDIDIDLTKNDNIIGIPANYKFNKADIPSGYTIVSDYSFDSNNNMNCLIYSNLEGEPLASLLSTSNTQFIQKSFMRYTYKETDKSKEAAPKDGLTRLEQLKCYPIKVKNDIAGEVLLIDPATGKPMKQYLEDSAKNISDTGSIKETGGFRIGYIIVIIILSILAIIPVIMAGKLLIAKSISASKQISTEVPSSSV
jgi:hypothetical protein